MALWRRAAWQSWKGFNLYLQKFVPIAGLVSDNIMRFILLTLASIFLVASAARDGVGVSGWLRRPVAVGALSGIRFAQEPHLLEFHGANCDHCDVSRPTSMAQ